MVRRIRPRRPPGGRSSLRTAFATSFALVAAAVTLLVGFLSYDAAAHLVRVDQKTVFNGVVNDLRDEVAHEPLDYKDFLAPDPDHDGPRDELAPPARTVVQVLGPTGGVADAGEPRLPVRAEDRGTAGEEKAGAALRWQTELHDDGYRVATVSLGGGRGAVQVAQQFSGTEDLLRELQQRTALFVACAILAAGVVGWWLAGRITGRLVRLTQVAETVAETGRMDVAVPIAGQDEVGRLGRAFDGMLGRLARSEDDQRRLVQDAGHELRTPLTSLRTNVSLLRRFEDLPPDAREELLADLAGETRELTDLVNELVGLAAGQHDDEPLTDVTLGEVARKAVVHARRRTGREIIVRADASAVRGRPAALQRAVSNLVENAAKFDRDGSAPVEVLVEQGRVSVLDRGPGIAEEDLRRIFDRFYRAAGARSLPGSGLGLAIVREVATAHGGTVFAEPRPGGGAVMGFTVRDTGTEEP